MTAFRGGFRLWHLDDVKTMTDSGTEPPAPPKPADWRLI